MPDDSKTPPLGRHRQPVAQAAPPMPEQNRIQTPYRPPEQVGPSLQKTPSPPVPPVGQLPLGNPQVTTYQAKFTGEAGEYFRIWIVNTALTLVTLGLYLPWARVRERQYFYGHTWVDDQNFEYTANPWGLLRGYLIVGVGWLLYSLGSYSEKLLWLSLLIGFLFVALYPWLVMKSVRFLAVSTVHRGLRFRHTGTVGEAYFAYALTNIASAFSGGLALPWAWFEQRKFQFANLWYGNAQFSFKGDVSEFYMIWLRAIGVGLASGVVAAIPVGIIASVFGTLSQAENSGVLGMVAGFVGAYFGFLLGGMAAWQYIRGATLHYIVNHLELGGIVRFRAEYDPWTLMWIGIGNMLAQIFTLGLSTPWAAIRRNRYIVDNITVRTLTSLADFSASNAPDEFALGEAATELLDIDLGF